MKIFFQNTRANIFLMLAIIVIGLVQFNSLPVSLYPTTSKPILELRVPTEGTNAEEFLRRFGSEIESKLTALNQVDKVRGYYRNGFSRFEIEFAWGVDSEKAKDAVTQSIQGFESSFPDHWRTPTVRFAGENSSQMYASISRKADTDTDLQALAEKIVVPRLLTIPGIEDVTVDGPSRRAIRITLNPDRMLAHDIHYDDVRSRLKEREYNQSLGRIRKLSGTTLQVSTDDKFHSIEDLRDTVIPGKDQRYVRLRDIATVEFEVGKPDRIYTSNGSPALMIGGVAKPDANLREVSNRFRDILRSEFAAIDPDIKTEMIINPASYIEGAISNVVGAVIASIVITTLVVYLFLRMWIPTMIICCAIPVSLVGGFILMSLFGIELNIISLGAMALSVGMVVDSAIVVVENITAKVENLPDGKISNALDIVWDGTREIAVPVTASLLTTIVVFLPLPFTAPLASAILGDLAIVIMSVMAVSLLTALVFVPSLYLFFLVALGARRRTQVHPHSDRIRHIYINALSKILSSKILQTRLITGIVICFGIAVLLMLTQVPRSLVDRADSELVNINVDINNESMDVEDKAKIIQNIEARVRDNFAAKIRMTTSEARTRGRSSVNVHLHDADDVDNIIEALPKIFVDTPEMTFSFQQWTPSSLKIPDPAAIRVQVGGIDPETVRSSLEKIEHHFRDDERFSRVDASPRTSKARGYHIDFNDETFQAIAQSSEKNAPDIDRIKQAITGALREERLYSSSMNGSEFPVFLEMPKDYRDSLSDIGNLLVRSGKDIVPLRSLASIRQTEEWTEFYSEDGSEMFSISAWPNANMPKQTEDAIADVKQKLSEDGDLSAVSLIYSDPRVEIDENLNSLLVALAFAALLIGAIVIVQFGSYRKTLIIFVAVPLGLIGVGFSLWIFQSRLNINSMLGIILLAGTSVNNSIILIDVFTEFAKRGMSSTDAILRASGDRIRPIMLTTLTTILGNLPIAFGVGSGASVLQPLGIAISGGLWISTMLTIFIVPLLASRCLEE
jgi:multidrug efflux pump subunit AcrB